MARVLQSFHSAMALEVARGERSVAFVRLNGATVAVEKMDKREFDQEFYKENISDRHGLVTPRRYCRHYLRLVNYPLEEGAVAAMIDAMALAGDEPRSDRTALLVEKNTGRFIGAYESPVDAQLVLSHIQTSGLIVTKPADMADWPSRMVEALRVHISPQRKPKAKTGAKYLQEIFAMAKAAEKQTEAAQVKASTKVEKTAKERVAKKDGPVAKVKEYVQKNIDRFEGGTLTLAQARVDLLKQGIVAGTIGVQLPKWIVALKVKNVQKGGTVRRNKETGEVSISKAKEPKVSTPKAPKAAPVAAPAAPAKAGKKVAVKKAPAKKAGKSKK